MDNLEPSLPIALWRHPVLIAIVFVFVLLCPKADAASRSKLVPVYVLKQKGTVFGNQVVYVSATSVRLDAERIDCSVVLRSPGEKVQIWSVKKKRYYESDLRKWHGELSKLGKFEKKCKKKGINWRVIKTVDVCGITCDEYILGRMRGATDPYNLSLPKDPNKKKVFVARSIPISKEAAALIGKSCGVSAFQKIPMRIQVWNKDELKNVIDTVSCEKKMLPESTFSVPANCARTDNEFEVVVQFGNETDPVTGIEDILFRSGTGRDKPSK